MTAKQYTPAEIDELSRRFFDDGIIYLPQVLSKPWMQLLELGFARNINNPGPFSRTHFPGDPDRETYDDYVNYNNNQEYQLLLRDSPLVPLMTSILKTENLWLFYDQIFQKEGGMSRRTPWHQDLTYFCAAGSQFSSAWITLDPVQADESLEFVRGSHRGPVYGGMTWDPNDNTKPFYTEWERIPDIEKDRGSYDIVSFDTSPGDVLFFHPGVLHGGAASRNKARRLSLRVFGDDAVLEARPDDKCAPPFPGIYETCEVGKPLRSAWFQPLYPTTFTPLLP